MRAVWTSTVFPQSSAKPRSRHIANPTFRVHLNLNVDFCIAILGSFRAELFWAFTIFFIFQWTPKWACGSSIVLHGCDMDVSKLTGCKKYRSLPLPQQPNKCSIGSNSITSTGIASPVWTPKGPLVCFLWPWRRSCVSGNFIVGSALCNVRPMASHGCCGPGHAWKRVL